MEKWGWGAGDNHFATVVAVHEHISASTLLALGACVLLALSVRVNEEPSILLAYTQSGCFW